MTITIYKGDCREKLKSIPDKIFHTVVTSPPYWGLRDYGINNQIGLEETPQEYIANMVQVFREVRRVLRDDGTLWLNLGDSYSSHKDFKSISQSLAKGNPSEVAHVIDKGKSVSRNTKKLKEVGLKNKDLIGIPWKVAFALQEDGWYLRQDIIWNKPNPMPESVKDRCTKSHEYIFLLSKKDKYYFDNESIKIVNDDEKSNKKSVWTVTTKPYKEAHFATYPPDLIEPCILAGCPEGGYVLDPFGGAGTTALVSDRLKRHSSLIELNDEYTKITEKRLRDDGGMFINITNKQ